MFVLSLPYQIGIAASLTAGFASIPLCFHLPTAEWFNMYYVTTDVPEPKDLRRPWKWELGHGIGWNHHLDKSPFCCYVCNLVDPRSRT
jgi:hypothetical protein